MATLTVATRCMTMATLTVVTQLMIKGTISTLIDHDGITVAPAGHSWRSRSTAGPPVRGTMAYWVHIRAVLGVAIDIVGCEWFGSLSRHSKPCPCHSKPCPRHTQFLGLCSAVCEQFGALK